MIPIRDSQWRGSVPYVTRALLILNILVFLYTLTLDAEAPAAVPIFTNQNAELFRESGGEIARQPVTLYPISERDEFALRFGAVPEFITGYLDGNNASHDVVESTRITRAGLERRPGTQGVNLLDGFWLLLTPLTAMFLHGGWLHLIGNMLFLWVFADNVEDRLGHWRFAIFYLLGGYLATAAHIFFDTSDLLPGIGASGAISAVLGAYLLLFPRSMVQVLIPFILLIPAVVPAPLMIGIWFVYNLISGVGSFAADTVVGGTAWFAHLGGFLAGMALIYPFLIGRWRAPRRYTGPTWNLPPRIGWMGRRPRRRRPPNDAAVVVDLQARPPRSGRRRRGLFRRSKRRPGVDAYRDFRRD